MLIRRTSLILKQEFFWNLLVLARLERLISIKTKEYFIWPPLWKRSITRVPKNVLKIIEIEVHTWKLNVLVDWVLFLIRIPRFQKQPLVPLGTDVKNWHVFKIKAVASFLGMVGQLKKDRKINKRKRTQGAVFTRSNATVALQCTSARRHAP